MKYLLIWPRLLKIPNVAFENTGDHRFVKRTDWLPRLPSFSYGASFADLDNDGDLDYVVNNINDEAFILRNTTVEKSKGKCQFYKDQTDRKRRQYNGYRCKGELWSKGKYQFTEHFLTRGYASSVDPVIHFGLSQDNTIDSIKVTWPASGNILQVLKNMHSQSDN